jgi:hypothetical protein
MQLSPIVLTRPMAYSAATEGEAKEQKEKNKIK